MNLTGCIAVCRLKLISPSYPQKPGRNQLCLPQMVEDRGALQVATLQQKPVMGKYNFMYIFKVFLNDMFVCVFDASYLCHIYCHNSIEHGPNNGEDLYKSFSECRIIWIGREP